jgi:hypothetical protein
MVKRGYGTGGNRRDPHRHFFRGVLMSVQDVVDASKMGEHANGRLAVVAEGFDDAIVPNAVRGAGLEANVSNPLAIDREEGSEETVTN